MTNYEYHLAFNDSLMTPELTTARNMLQNACIVGKEFAAPIGHRHWLRGFAAGKMSVAQFSVQDPIVRQTLVNECKFLEDYFWRHVNKFD